MAKKDEILKTTLRLLTEYGFHATPMSLVAREAKVAAGTIYHYFESKEALIDQLYAQQMQQMSLALLQHDDPSRNFYQRFFTFWVSLFDYFTQNPQEFRFLEQYTNSPYYSRQSRESTEVYYRPVLEFLQEGIDTGKLRSMDLALIRALVYGSVVSVVKLHLTEELPITQPLLQQAVQSCWDSVRSS